jgi:hypothetical protein
MENYKSQLNMVVRGRYDGLGTIVYLDENKELCVVEYTNSVNKKYTVVAVVSKLKKANKI